MKSKLWLLLRQHPIQLEGLESLQLALRGILPVLLFTQWDTLEDETLNIEQPIVINGVEYPFFYNARTLIQGVDPIFPLALRHGDQCAEFLFLLSKVNKLLIINLGRD